MYKVQDETTISGIIAKLKGNVKGESPNVLKAKLLNIKQKGKTTSQYTTEIDNLRKQLEAAYIDDGLDPNNAEKCSSVKKQKMLLTGRLDYADTEQTATINSSCCSSI